MNPGWYLPTVAYIDHDINGNVLQPADWRMVPKTIQVISEEYPQTGHGFLLSKVKSKLTIWRPEIICTRPNWTVG